MTYWPIKNYINIGNGWSVLQLANSWIDERYFFSLKKKLSLFQNSTWLDWLFNLQWLAKKSSKAWINLNVSIIEILKNSDGILRNDKMQVPSWIFNPEIFSFVENQFFSHYSCTYTLKNNILTKISSYFFCLAKLSSS